jgi:iron complex outermembrane recepter protein
MSELIKKNDNRATIRWKLLTGVSALALTAYVSSAGVAKAEDADRPLVWVELGGQAEHVDGQGALFVPGFLAKYPNSAMLWKGTSPIQAQRPSYFSYGEEGKISFQPENSDWVFSAAIRYGRSGGFKEIQHETTNIFYIGYKISNHKPVYGQEPHGTNVFADTRVDQSESHSVLDFSAGKDVGLGMFGSGSSSVLSAGVRFAQFASRSTVDMRARPELDFKYATFYHFFSFKFPKFHNYHATGQAERNFHGIGPSISWAASAPFAGNQQDGELTFDWGANAALLFGRQKARVRHREAGYYRSFFYQQSHGSHPSITVYHNPQRGHDANRAVTVPNIGGFAGVSWRVQDFKVSMGYRADFFFNAIDGGIDTRKSENRGFFGPYASISIGLGN